MATLILLGTGAALSDETRENTYMVVQGASSSILIDCGGSPIQRLKKAEVRVDSLDHVILTHHHPDHLYGLSILLLDLWLLGRKKPLHIYGLAETLRAARSMMHAFEWERWFGIGFFPVEFHRVPKKPGALFTTQEFTIHTATTRHLLPTIAVRLECKSTGRSIAYSSDTEVCDPVAKLASGVDILFHESTTISKPVRGHSSAVQAGALAQSVGAKKLVLVHLPPGGDVKKLRAAGKKYFKRRVVVGKDFARFDF